MAYIANGIVFGMDKSIGVFFVDSPANDLGILDNFARRKVFKARKICLGIHYRVKIPTVSNVKYQFTQFRAINGQIIDGQIAFHIDQLDPIRLALFVLVIADFNQTDWSFHLNMSSFWGIINSLSTESVTVPLVPWPHMGRQPYVSMNKMAKSFSES